MSDQTTDPQTEAPKTTAHSGTCPHCGYCPTCGRSNVAPAPVYPWLLGQYVSQQGSQQTTATLSGSYVKGSTNG